MALHLSLFNIRNEGFSYVPALNAWLIQFPLSRLHPIGRNRSRRAVPDRKMQDFKREAEVGRISIKISKTGTRRPEYLRVISYFHALSLFGIRLPLSFRSLFRFTSDCFLPFYISSFSLILPTGITQGTAE